MDSEKKEYLEKAKKKIIAYNAAIKRMNAEIDGLLDGQPETTEREDGMKKYHPKYNEIKKVRYEMSQIERSLMICKHDYETVLNDK